MSKRSSKHLRISFVRVRRKEKFVQTYSFGILRRTELHVLRYIVWNYFCRFLTGCSLINDAISCNFIWIKREQEGQLADSRSSSFLINFLRSLHLNLNSNFLATLSATILLPYELLSPPRRRCNLIDAFFRQSTVALDGLIVVEWSDHQRIESLLGSRQRKVYANLYLTVHRVLY